MRGVGEVGERGCFDELICDIAELGSYLMALPMAGMLPVPTAGASAIAAHLGKAIGETSEPHCAMKTLVDTFTFLGGHFVEHTAFAVEVPGDPPPLDRKGRWKWLCQSAMLARDESQRLWERLVDPIQ